MYSLFEIIVRLMSIIGLFSDKVKFDPDLCTLTGFSSTKMVFGV